MTGEEYMTKRFPRATEAERAKIVLDWDKKLAISEGVLADFVKRTGRPVAGLSILDAGSGNGDMSICFSRAGAKIIGVDVEEDLVAIARARSVDQQVAPEFILYDGGRLPAEDDVFDAALSVSVLEHVTDPVNYLQEILRTVKPDGCLYLAFPNRLWPKETHTGLWFVTYVSYSLTDRLVRFFGKNPLADNNLHFYGYWSLSKMLNKAQVGDYRWQLVPEKGETKNKLKIVIKNILNFGGLNYKIFLPHISVILRKEKLKV